MTQNKLKGGQLVSFGENSGVIKETMAFDSSENGEFVSLSRNIICREDI